MPDLNALIARHVFGIESRVLTVYDGSSGAFWLIVTKLDSLGWHAKLQSPFTPGDRYWAGFTPHGVTGWNGRPDHEAGTGSMGRSVCLAALMALGVEIPPELKVGATLSVLGVSLPAPERPVRG